MDKQASMGLSAGCLCVVQAGFAQGQVPGLPWSLGMLLLLHQLRSVHCRVAGGGSAQLLLGQEGRRRSLGIQESCAVFTGLALCLWAALREPHSFSHPIFRLIPAETSQVATESIYSIFGPGRIC